MYLPSCAADIQQQQDRFTFLRYPICPMYGCFLRLFFTGDFYGGFFYGYTSTVF